MSNFPPAAPSPSSPQPSQRVLCGIMGLLFGGLGIHRFILGDALGGIIRIVITVATCGFGSILGFIEGILYLTKTDDQFVAEYQVGKKAWF